MPGQWSFELKSPEEVQKCHSRSVSKCFLEDVYDMPKQSMNNVPKRNTFLKTLLNLNHLPELYKVNQAPLDDQIIFQFNKVWIKWKYISINICVSHLITYLKLWFIFVKCKHKITLTSLEYFSGKFLILVGGPYFLAFSGMVSWQMSVEFVLWH